MTTHDMVAALLAWGIYPLWLIAGAADLWCHRRTDIRHTSGVVESTLHLAQLGVIGVAAGLFLFLDVTTTTACARALHRGTAGRTRIFRRVARTA